jgi:hypothetical protein
MSKPGVDDKSKKEESKAKPQVGLVLKDVPSAKKDSSPTEQEKLKQENELFYQHKKRAERIEYLKKLFAKVFNEEQWECSVKGKNFQYKNKKNPRQIVYIEKKKGEVCFSGEPIEKVIDAAKAYEEDCGHEMKYAVECDTLEVAISYMTELHQKGFDINKIESIDAKDGKKYEIAKIIAEINKNHPKPKGPKLSTTQAQKNT